MKTNMSPKIAALSAYVIVTMLGVSQAMAQGFNTNGQSAGNVARNINTSLQGFGPLINTILYLLAFAMLVIAIFKFKAHSEQPDRTPLAQGFKYLAVAVCAAGAPELLGTGLVTAWGAGAQTVPVP